MRSEWASTTARPHLPPSETNRKDFEPAPNSAATTSGYAMPSVYYLRRRLLRHHSSQTEEDPCTETDSTQGSCGSPLQKYHPSPPQGRRRTSSCADGVCYPRTSDLDSSLVSSSSGSGGAPPARLALKVEAQTQAAPFKWPPTTIPACAEWREQQSHSLDAEDVSQMTAASEVPADDDAAKPPAEDQTEEGEAQAMQPAEPSVPPTPQFLRPTIEIDSSDILHTAKPEIDEGDFGVGLSYTKMTEAEFVARLSIHEAARTGDLHVIKLLLKSDPKRMETVDERGWTPIHLAAANGHAEVVRYLAVEGADVAALDPTSYTAMHLAAMNGHNACLEVLLKMGADVDNITADGFTPLHLAALNNYADCVRTLLSWGANLAVEDALGRTVQDMVEEYALDDVSALLSGLWAHVDKYTQSRKQNGQSGSGGRKRSTRKLVQMAAAAMGKR
ncbi:hypothetical protein MRX96_000823 [Rhipicephalus microplus]